MATGRATALQHQHQPDAGGAWRDPTLWVVLAGAFAFRLWANRTFENLAWPDEVFQTLEQGHRLAFGYGVIPWEFRDGVRSWVLPAALAGVMRLAEGGGQGSSGYLFGVHAFLALASLAPVAVSHLWARRAGFRYPFAAALACATWFELVFLGGKALTEVMAGHTIAVALFAGLLARESPSARRWLVAGALWGLVLGLRFHLAPAAMVGVAWMARRDVRAWACCAGGMAASLAVFGVVDWATWGSPWRSIWYNFHVNVIQGKARSFGSRPFEEYVVSLGLVWSWAAAPLLGLAAIAFRRWSALWLTALAVLISHSVVSHKEYRFLAPFLVIVAMSAGLGLAELLARRRAPGLALGAMLLAGSGIQAVRYDWNDLAPRWKGLPPVPVWTQRRGALQAYRFLSTDPSVCGVASVGVGGWGWTGGFTYLHRDVPMFDPGADEGFLQSAGAYNVILATEAHGAHFGPYARGECWEGFCLYRRPGPCEPVAGYHINRWLEQHGD